MGRELLVNMERLGIVLDVSHMAEQSFYDAIDLFHGAVIASHSNCRAIVKTDRQLSDDMIRQVILRHGVIGAVVYNRFLKQDWDKSSLKEAVVLADVVRHIEHLPNCRRYSSRWDWDGL